MGERGEEEKALQNFFALIVYTSFRQNALLINFFAFLFSTKIGNSLSFLPSDLLYIQRRYQAKP